MSGNEASVSKLRIEALGSLSYSSSTRAKGITCSISNEVTKEIKSFSYFAAFVTKKSKKRFFLRGINFIFNLSTHLFIEFRKTYSNTVIFFFNILSLKSI